MSLTSRVLAVSEKYPEFTFTIEDRTVPAYVRIQKEGTEAELQIQETSWGEWFGGWFPVYSGAESLEEALERGIRVLNNNYPF